MQKGTSNRSRQILLLKKRGQNVVKTLLERMKCETRMQKKKKGGNGNEPVQLDQRCLGWPYIFINMRVWMRVRSQEEGGRRDDTKGLIVLAGDSPGLHGRWPGNGYFYPWNTHVQARARFTGHRILIDDYFDETLLAILEGGEGVEFIHEHASIGDR